MLVQDFLHESSRMYPDKVALVCAGERLTYDQIEQQANRLARALHQHGVQRGDRVAIFLNNSAEAVVATFAILKAGGVFVMVNHTTKPEKLIFILSNCRAVGVLVDQRFADQGQLDRVLAGVASLKFAVVCGGPAPVSRPQDPRQLNYAVLQAAFPPSRPPTLNIDLDLACLIYTSGSTGDPKGVMCDHSNVVFAAGSIISYLRNRESDIVLNVLPLAFDYGLYQLLMTFKFGGTLILENSFAFPAVILKRMVEEKVTGFPGVPTIFALLVQLDLSPYDLSALRYLTNTAAALPPTHITDLRNKFPSATLYSMYGLTETKRTLYLPPQQLDLRPGSVGIAIPGTEVWIEGDAGQRLGPGEVGELVSRGRHVMRGYWENPTATAARFRAGPLPGEQVCHTGDLFRMDEAGYLYFVGRQDDIIKSRGEKVAPKEVENVLYGLRGVTEAAVIGVNDPILGQAIKAILVVKDAPLTSAEVLAHCRAHLEDFMVPRIVEFRSELPKTTSGKIKKTALT